MRLLRGIGWTVLWAMAGVGVLSGFAWVANAAGWVQPLVVVSGSMEPEIATGDLIVARLVPVSEVSPGDVITVMSDRTQKLVTHRIVDIEDGTGQRTFVLKGDANDAVDAQTYTLAAADRVPTPWFTVPGAGRAVETITRPAVAIPVLIALAALVGLTALPDPARVHVDDAHAVEQGAS